MPAILDHDERGLHRFRGSLGRFERDGILASVRDQRGGANGVQHPRLREVEVAEALPDRLLDPADHTKWGEVARPSRISEVASDAQLEGALAIRIGIGLLKSRRGELLAQLAHDRASLPRTELLLEALAE